MQLHLGKNGIVVKIIRRRKKELSNWRTYEDHFGIIDAPLTFWTLGEIKNLLIVKARGKTELVEKERFVEVPFKSWLSSFLPVLVETVQGRIQPPQGRPPNNWISNWWINLSFSFGKGGVNDSRLIFVLYGNVTWAKLDFFWLPASCWIERFFIFLFKKIVSGCLLVRKFAPW